MKRNASIQKLAVAALLVAVGIVIPIFMPVKIILEPASFTLASHVALMLAMFISPTVTAAVAAGTALGFFLAGVFPAVVVARAASQVVFAVAGALFLRRYPNTLNSIVKTQLFSLAIGVVHALGEVLVTLPFYVAGTLADGFYEKNFFTAVILLVGLGTLVHSMVDFAIALLVYAPLRIQRPLQGLFLQPEPKTQRA